CNQQGTWTATASCGLPPYYYVWYYYKPCNPASPSGGENTQPLLPPCGSWLQTGNNSPTYSRSDCSDFEVKCCVNDATNHSATSNIIYVSITGGFAKFAENDESQRTLLTRETLNNEFSFSQNYPNPFNPTTEIHFTLPMESHVQLVVYDMLGREVAQLVNEQMEAGYHSIQWNAGNMSSGIYIYKLSADNLVEVKRMVVTK
ncbi:MAG: T9SS type A sorting domain-containing protein, partial [Bacteroidota bacterium]|nr:T9SS type A sorting domain-containing protein [Bacteroidota bacterium]